jgi:hypothetical protein
MPLPSCGKVYEQLPINERDAAIRFQKTFSRDIVTREHVDSPQHFVNEEYPYTLDLRRPF